LKDARNVLSKAHISIYTPDLSTGGVGKMRLHLIREMIDRGLRVDLLLADTRSPLFRRVPEPAQIFTLPSTHSVASLFALYRYLRNEQPDVLITDRLRLNIACQRARRLAGVRTKLFLSIHNPISVKLEGMRYHERRRLLKKIRRWMPNNEKIIAVSHGVAADVTACVGLPADRIATVYNPVITPELTAMAKEPVDHAYFQPNQGRVVLCAGRMTEQKDFATLLQAFATVRRQTACKLILLGNHGRYYADLQSQIDELGLSDDVDMPGFDSNPYRYMSRSDVYVLSSRWEGFGNVLVEALALGLPVVSTDCPVGPREILQNGRLGALVPVGDPDAMARAILETLDGKPDRQRLIDEVRPFTVENSVDGYLTVFGLV
jgi:glycosyltransferase involved in cell wall biosynthesis